MHLRAFIDDHGNKFHSFEPWWAICSTSTPSSPLLGGEQGVCVHATIARRKILQGKLLCATSISLSVVFLCHVFAFSFSSSSLSCQLVVHQVHSSSMDKTFTFSCSTTFTQVRILPYGCQRGGEVEREGERGATETRWTVCHLLYVLARMSMLLWVCLCLSIVSYN